MLTQQQRRVLDAIAAYLAAHGYAPSQADLAAELDLSPSTVRGHLRALERRGAIERPAGRRRAIRLVVEFVQAELEDAGAENGEERGAA